MAKENEALKKFRENYRAQIADRIREAPDLSYESIGREFFVSTGMVYTVAREFGLRREKDATVTEASND
jgi:hypothetical protein